MLRACPVHRVCSSAPHHDPAVHGLYSTWIPLWACGTHRPPVAGAPRAFSDQPLPRALDRTRNVSSLQPELRSWPAFLGLEMHMSQWLLVMVAVCPNKGVPTTLPLHTPLLHCPFLRLSHGTFKSKVLDSCPLHHCCVHNPGVITHASLCIPPQSKPLTGLPFQHSSQTQGNAPLALSPWREKYSQVWLGL